MVDICSCKLKSRHLPVCLLRKLRIMTWSSVVPWGPPQTLLWVSPPSHPWSPCKSSMVKYNGRHLHSCKLKSWHLPMCLLCDSEL